MAREREEKEKRLRPKELEKTVPPQGGRDFLHNMGTAGSSPWDGGIYWKVQDRADPGGTQR